MSTRTASAFGIVQHGAQRLQRVALQTAFCAAALSAISTTAHAQWRAGAFIGGEHESSWSHFLVVGADARGPIGSTGLEINPRFSYFIRDKLTRFQIDANVIKPLVLANKTWIEPYVGFGLAFEHITYDNSDPLFGFDTPPESNFGYNYIVGGKFNTTSRIQPFGQFQYSILHDAANNAVISVGVHFKFGSSAAPAPAPAPQPVAPTPAAKAPAKPPTTAPTKPPVKPPVKKGE